MPWVLDACLVVVGSLGLVSLLWSGAAAVLGLGFVTFATGSMAPRFPAGSVALSAPLPLDRVEIGDVVTVERGSGRPPITHRVVEIRHAASDGAVVLRLKGDANRQRDPVDYVVTRLRRVVAPLPPVADLLRLTGSPEAVATTATIVAASLTWAFWPGNRETPRPSRTRSSSPAGGRHRAVP